ncbi:MAG: carboxy terminal-processing peptidase [Puniceicoccales bacterium]|jgi:carboxyl-terminal processing protease|nr:carboxy terminal-processing peptidase [Puniceicoccales bacterium]
MQAEVLIVKSCFEDMHYAKKLVSQLSAEEILKAYFANIDNSHMLFFAPEIQHIIQSLSPKLHSFLQKGDLTKAFEIFDLYRCHVWERTEWILNEIPALELQSLVGEKFNPYRKELPWPQDVTEADHLWKQRLLYEIQSEILVLENVRDISVAVRPFYEISFRCPTDVQSTEECCVIVFPFLEELYRKEKNFPYLLTDGSYSIPSRLLSWICSLSFLSDGIQEELPSQENIAKAKERISKRYESFQRFLADIESWFVQELFLNSIAQFYDPYSGFLSKDSFEEFNVVLRNALVGIGVYLYYDNGYCTIKELTPGGPAARSQQLHPGDRIVAVADDEQEAVEITNMPSYRSVRLIRGGKGTRVHLTIEPAEGDAADRKIVTLIRDTVSIENARASAKLFTLSDKEGTTSFRIGYIQLPSFYGPDEEHNVSYGCTSDVRCLLQELMAKGMEGLIFDLRDNGGGLLEEAITLAGLFISSGPIVQVRDPEGGTKIYHSHPSTSTLDIPMATLVSRQSASAAEILVGALREHCRSIIVGDKCTHGKGSVQVLIPLEHFFGSWLNSSRESAGAARITVNKWYRPSGSSIQLRGVPSDIPLPSFDEWVPIGESDLPHALPWDAIVSSASAKPFISNERKYAFAQLIQKLRQQSELRQRTLPEFAVLNTRICLFRQKIDNEEFSLDMRQRKKERREDFRLQWTIQEKIAAISAQPFFSFTSISLPSSKSSSQLDKLESQDSSPPKDLKADSSSREYDTHLRESLRVMRDWICLQKGMAFTS